ncbi:SRPBCC domain-containing protein [Brevundimonas sp.]|uniref:SRPBCC domain-containing protein n=1 Tax=Brevundimonas sp. TaxID=1871086 RepID=UPI002D735ED2|nr:SRPBCC domain-containing protein [Brevundimonas sp.]HYC97634.1 SRPBCC domain-containing protein [Brevundimonas sp.]
MTGDRLFFGAFTVERTYAASPVRVFAAFTDRGIKQRWMGCEEVRAPVIEQLDFRVGGREISRGGGGDGAEHLFEGTYLDIVPDLRFVFAFVMHVGGRKLSASIASVEVLADPGGARLIFNEQGVYFGEDGWAEREEGTVQGMKQLAAWLATQDEAA